MKRVNVRFLLLFLVALALLAGGMVALNRYQVDRNAGTLAKQARQRLEEGKQAEALGLFARYLGMRPEDAEVHAEYAELVLERALAADATQADLSRAFNPLAEAVRRNPEKDSLRRKATYETVQRDHQKISPFVIMSQQIEVAVSRAGVTGYVIGPSFDNNYYHEISKK